VENLLSQLTVLGFSEYEGRVYLALLEENPATGYQLSKRSGVPRSMVYEALGRLANRGAVMLSDTRRATFYQPVPPDAMLDRFLEEQAGLVQGLRGFLQAAYSETSQDLLWSFHGRGALLSQVYRMLDEAQEELLLVLSDEDLEDLSERVISAHARGLTLGSLLTGDGELTVGQVARHPPLESEIQGLTGMLVVVQDRRQVLIANRPAAGEPRATLTTNLNLVLLAHQFIWMELFAQRIYARLGPDLLASLEPEDREILEVYAGDQ
jgi:Cd2+/Zn2+-exporting ATPase